MKKRLSNKKAIRFDPVLLAEFKVSFQEWSGFEFHSENLEDAKKEIEDIQYQLECEVSDRASRFQNKIKLIFPDLDI